MCTLPLGSNHLYVFVNPLNKKLADGVPENIDWDFAQKELAENSGFSTLQSGLTKGKYFGYTICENIRIGISSKSAKTDRMIINELECKKRYDFL